MFHLGVSNIFLAIKKNFREREPEPGGGGVGGRGVHLSPRIH